MSGEDEGSTGEFRMPSLGAGMEEGTVMEWHVGPGDHVRRGDVIGVVDTEKGAIDVEIWEDGEVVEVLAPPGTKVPVGEPLLALRAPGEAEEAQAAREEAPEAAPPTDEGAEPEEGWLEEAAEPEAEPPPPETPGHPQPEEPRVPRRESPGPPAPEPARREGRVRASPAARLRAEELGLDLSYILGSGPHGAVTLQDVEEAAVTPGEPEAEAEPGAEDLAADRESRELARSWRRARRDRTPKVTPVARRAARHLGVPVEGIRGTGPGGAVTREDVEREASVTGAREDREGVEEGVAEAAPEGAATDEEAPTEMDPRARMRRAVAAAMTRSKREIPHYYLATTVPMEKALRWMEERNRDRAPDERLLPVALHVKAMALALTRYPELNGFWEEGSFRSAEQVHVGLAVSLRGGGLVAPALHRASERSLDDLTRGVRDVVFRARAGKLRGSELADPTVTLTSLGDRGVEAVFGVIHPPQVAILGAGTTVERPWARDGMVGTQRVVHVTLSADHRVSDGHRGGLFLDDVARRLQTPEEL